MKAVAMLARKGGAGKTTCAIHMGVLAAAAGHKVVFFDLDPQRSLAAWWQGRKAETPALVETNARRLPDLLRSAAGEGYDLAVIDTPPAVSFDTAQVAAAGLRRGRDSRRSARPDLCAARRRRPAEPCPYFRYGLA